MAAEHSRSDYITTLALSRAHLSHPLSGARHEPHVHHTPRLPTSVIPDLRFEQTYLKKIKPHVHVERKGKGKEREHERGEVISVEWKKVVWITARDQVISPLLQGALWGAASIFLRPMLGSLAAYLFPPAKHHPQGQEGTGAGWLRRWARSLFGGVGPALSQQSVHR
ncbi:hypothetical protein BV25DRAFT_1915275 [Artomyces pyxidatus]|uniref:Uncharacterized protein n=1 Tax=Artomyces pyxidatus TaxID=48021 RepID=A0ACB8T615_9AGAM|nr:hypothetical protein BV25DRAFT_1915275 [Artomyces pyxidatus]